MSATQLTNEQYEEFDPDHKVIRGRHGLSKDDDEAVLFVSWYGPYTAEEKDDPIGREDGTVKMYKY